jgi:hypothetical protein
MIDRSLMTIKKPYVLVVPHVSHIELSEFAWRAQFTQYSVLKTEDGWELTAPLDEKNRVAYAWLFHKMAGLETADKTPPKGNPPKGTPPRGGTPGAGRKKKEPVLLNAVAA